MDEGEWTRADYDYFIEKEIKDGNDWVYGEDAIRQLDMDKELMEVCLKDLNKAKEKYEKAITEGNVTTKIIEDLELKDDVAYHQATDFWGTIIMAQEFLTEEELKPYWITWREYFNEEINNDY